MNADDLLTLPERLFFGMFIILYFGSGPITTDAGATAGGIAGAVSGRPE